ncbi:MAG: GntR family transcriptional regulator [Pyrinomonadaceae bacterium]
MKLWLAKDNGVPIKEQLATQILLGIASGDISPGDKLPSRAELARRFDIHENTVSNAYRVLTERGLVEFRSGAGFYALGYFARTNKKDLASLAARFYSEAISMGYESADILRAVNYCAAAGKGNDYVVVEEDPALREIMIQEVRSRSGARVTGIHPLQIDAWKEAKCEFLALEDEKPRLGETIPTCRFLRVNSVTDALKSAARPSADALIAVVSGWEGFLKYSQTMLAAAAIDADSIVLRLTSEKDWKRGLDSASIIICDSLTASLLPESEKIRVFPIIASDSIEEI